jgi:hypothetical protein
MFSYTQAAMERTMKVQEVILRALAKKMLGNPAKCAGFPLFHRLGGGYGRLMKPDISLATKSGHFNLLTT